MLPACPFSLCNAPLAPQPEARDDSRGPPSPERIREFWVFAVSWLFLTFLIVMSGAWVPWCVSGLCRDGMQCSVGWPAGCSARVAEMPHTCTALLPTSLPITLLRLQPLASRPTSLAWRPASTTWLPHRAR